MIGRILRGIWETITRRPGHDDDRPSMVRLYDDRGNLLKETPLVETTIRYQMADGYRELTPEGRWLWVDMPPKS